MSELPSVLAIMIMVVNLAISHKSPLVSWQSSYAAKKFETKPDPVKVNDGFAVDSDGFRICKNCFNMS